MSEHRTYFGPATDPLYGTLHLPDDGPVRGGVVLCPPLGKELFDTVRGMRLLAARLTTRGFAVLRFEWFGTGNSGSFTERDDVVARWHDSAVAAVAFLRGLTGTAPAVVGLRAGALLAAGALPAAGPVGPVVLWDPVGHGRTWLREQEALYRMTVGAADDDPGAGSEAGSAATVALIGTTLTRAAHDDLRARRLDPAVRTLAPRWLLAVRTGGPDRAVRELAAAGVGPDVDTVVVEGMDAFVAAPDYLVVIPLAAIDAVVDWLDTHAGDIAGAAVVGVPPLRSTAVHVLPDGTAVTEHLVALGPHALAGVRTEPVDGVTDRTALLLATANDTAHGPNRAWVDLARAAAGAGAAAVRFDRRGAGDSGPVVAGETVRPYSATAMEDALDVAALCGPPQRLMVAGVCSGAWHAALVGRRGGAGAVVVVNAVLWSWRHKNTLTGMRTTADTLGGVPRTDPAFTSSRRGRIKATLARRLPYPGWRLLGHAGVTQVPEVLLRPLLRRGTDVTVVLAPQDAQWFDGQRGAEGLRRLRRPVRMVRTDVGDHTAYHPAVRAALAAHVLRWATREGRPVAEAVPS